MYPNEPPINCQPIFQSFVFKEEQGNAFPVKPISCAVDLKNQILFTV